MAGIGIKLNKIYSRNSIITGIAGAFYSTVVTVAPMVVIMLCVFLMERVLGFSKISYSTRELFSCTVLYVFIFSLCTAAPFNSVISRYLSDIIYDEKLEDILPCFYTGLIMNVIFSAIVGIPFYVHEYVVGEVDFLYVFVSYCAYMSLMLIFYSMLYLSICKDYTKITVFYALGMVVAFCLAWIFNKLLDMEVTFSMLLGLAIGFFLIAALEMGQIKDYFKDNSGNYKGVLEYFKKYWQLVVANFCYTIGLYTHNFVFWTTDLHIIVVKSYVCCEPFDMATYLAMLTSISCSVIFISNVERRFHGRYKDYSEAVIGGKLSEIARSELRMFRQLSFELMNISRTQFIITVVLFLAVVVLLPLYGMSGLVMQIYPCLAAAYYVIFIMYGAIVFLYYYNDLNGAAATSVTFMIVNLIVSIFATKLNTTYYGLGAFVGAVAGFSVAFYRLRWVERNIERHIFCVGTLIPRGQGEKPDAVVYTNAKRRKLVDREKEKDLSYKYEL